MKIASYPLGSTVIEDGDDPNEPEQIGVVVEPTDAELAEGREGYCGFDEDPSEYVLVAWSWSDEPGKVIDRCWEFVGDLKPHQESA